MTSAKAASDAEGHCTCGDVRYRVRVGTLEDPGRLSPDIHIFTSSKLPWVVLPQDVPAVPEYYSLGEYWPESSLERLRALKERA